MRCRPLMAAYVLRAFRQDDADIRERIGHIHRCVSNRSSNFGADKSVTVPARASRIRVRRDMIDGEMRCRYRSSRPVGDRWTSVKRDGSEGRNGARYVQMSGSMWG